MFSRFRIAFGLALSLTLLTSITVFAKGSFAFITITGPDLKKTIRSTDPALTTDFFAFAEFYQDQTDAPAYPGVGYEVTRYYMDGGRESAFDRLHYYPDSDYVYFDGLVNGSSEYDGKWYRARPEIKAIFNRAVTLARVVETQPQSSVFQAQSDNSTTLTEPLSLFTGTQSIVLLSVIAGLVVIAGFAYWRRRYLTH